MKNKRLGYLATQYFDYYLKGGSGQQEEPYELTGVFDMYREKAKDAPQPSWPVKRAGIAYTFDEKYYYLGPGRLSCTGEVFELLSDGLIDDMYAAGAYDMFYTGMLD